MSESNPPAEANANANANADASPQETPSLFQVLCASIAAQIQIALGLLVAPDQELPEVDLEAARHGIDMLAMLEEKTQGNISEQESKTLGMLLSQLRMIFVQKASATPSAEDAKTEEE